MSLYVVRVMSFGTTRSYVVCEHHRAQSDAKFGGMVLSVKRASGEATTCDLCVREGRKVS